MPVFTKKLSKIGISYIDGTMIIFPACFFDDRLTALQVAMANAAFSGGPTLAEQNSLLIRDINQSLYYVRRVFDKFFRHDDGESCIFFYSDEDSWFYDISLKSGLNYSEMDDILHGFEACGVISLAEKDSLLRDFYFRYVSFRESLDRNLTGLKSDDLTRIMEKIVGCEDNDLLVDLHKHLLAEKFDYLRVKTGFSSFSFWRGTDRSGSIVSTTKSWATIEKSITLKMAENAKSRSAHFYGDLSPSYQR